MKNQDMKSKVIKKAIQLVEKNFARNLAAKRVELLKCRYIKNYQAKKRPYRELLNPNLWFLIKFFIKSNILKLKK